MSGSSIFKGTRFYGESKFKRVTDGKVRCYAEFPDYQEPCSKISKKELQWRVHFIEDVVHNVAKDESTSILYTELVRLNKDIFMNAIKEGGINVMETITAKDAMSIQSLLRLPTNKMRNLRICLSNLRMNILPSERKMRKA